MVEVMSFESKGMNYMENRREEKSYEVHYIFYLHMDNNKMSIFDCCNGYFSQINQGQSKTTQNRANLALSRKNITFNNDKIKLSKNNTQTKQTKNAEIKPKQKSYQDLPSQLQAAGPVLPFKGTYNKISQLPSQKNTTQLLIPTQDRIFFANHPKEGISIKNIPSQKIVFNESCKKIVYFPVNQWRPVNQCKYPHTSKTLANSPNASFYGQKKIELDKPLTAFNSRICSIQPSIKRIQYLDFKETESIDGVSQISEEMSFVVQGEDKMYISHLISGRQNKKEYISTYQNQGSTNHNSSQVY